MFNLPFIFLQGNIDELIEWIEHRVDLVEAAMAKRLQGSAHSKHLKNLASLTIVKEVTT